MPVKCVYVSGPTVGESPSGARSEADVAKDLAEAFNAINRTIGVSRLGTIVMPHEVEISEFSNPGSEFTKRSIQSSTTFILYHVSDGAKEPFIDKS